MATPTPTPLPALALVVLPSATVREVVLEAAWIVMPVASGLPAAPVTTASSRKACVSELTTVTATAPANPMLPSLVRAASSVAALSSGFASAVSERFGVVPVLADAPPGEEIAIVATVFVEVAASETASPLTLEPPSMSAVVASVMYETATDAPFPALRASAMVTAVTSLSAWMLMLPAASRSLAPRIFTLAWLEMSVSATAASVVSAVEPSAAGLISAVAPTLERALMVRLPPALI